MMRSVGRPAGVNSIKIFKKDLVELYVKQKLPIRRVAEIKNCSVAPVRKALKYYNIPIRSISEAMRISTIRRLEYERQSQYKRKRG